LNQAQGSLSTFTFTDEMEIASPFSVVLDDFNTTTMAVQNGYLLLAEEESGGDAQIWYDEGEDASHSGTGTTFNSTYDDSFEPRGGYLGRITFSTGTEATLEWDLGSSVINQRVIGIVAMLKPTTVGRTYKIYATTENDGGQVNGRTYPTIELDGESTPRPIFLGYVVAPRQSGAHKKIQLYVEVDNFGTVYFDIDCIAAIGFDNPHNRIISVLPPDTTNVLALNVHPYTDESAKPLIEIELSGPVQQFCGWYGDAYLVSRLQVLKAMYLSGGDNNRWQYVNGTGTVLTPDWTVTRTKAYLTPK